MLFWQQKHEVKRVPNGKRVRVTCGSCKKTAMFYECTIEKNFALYVVLELWKDTKRVMQCGECLAVCDYKEMFPDDDESAPKSSSGDTERDGEQKRKQAEEDARLKQAEQEEHQRQAERDAVRKKNEAEVDDELSKLKEKFGK